MPGLSFICDFKEDLRNREDDILRSLDSLIHFVHYKKNILLKGKTFFLGCTIYDEYPITSFENEEYLIILEGKIYNKEHNFLKKDLINLSEIIFDEKSYLRKERIIEWLLNTDGDFILFALHKKSKNAAILNDILGRLPLYYYKNNGKILVSREVRFISNYIDDAKFDRMAIAQYLLFGYSLGKRTLLDGIYRLEPATLIRININNLEIEMDNLYYFNFDNREYNSLNVERNAAELVSLFSEGCKNRYDFNNNNIVSMSGGLDSRSVAACLYKNNLPFLGVSRMRYNDKKEIRDVEVAKKLANALNIDFNIITIDSVKGNNFLKLLKLKNGLNYLGMSFILPYLEKIKEIYGSKLTFFTGVGGSVVKPLISFKKKFKKLDELVNFIISENHIFSLDQVSALIRIQKHEIINELKLLLLSYPEKNCDQKYVHFLNYELDFKWCNEGDDRNRYYFWNVTPFSSINFFNYAMNCPEEQKTNYKLYRNFLLKLLPEISNIDYAHYMLPITSKKLLLKLLTKSILKSILNELPNEFNKIIKKQYDYHSITKYKDNSNIIKCLREELNNCKFIHNYLSNLEILNTIQSCSKLQVETLFTITSSIEDFESKNKTIEKYYDAEFI